MTDDEGGHRPQCDMMVSWRFTVSKRDALLILKALGGRLVSDEEIVEAALLGDRLTVMRANSGQDYVQYLTRAAEKALSNAEKT